MGKKIEFDRTGKCPICRKPFRSEACPHSYDYVKRAVDVANSNFDRDVRNLRKRRVHSE